MPAAEFLDRPTCFTQIGQGRAQIHINSPPTMSTQTRPVWPSVPRHGAILGAYQSTDVLPCVGPPAGRGKDVAKTEDGMRRVRRRADYGKTPM